MAINRTADDFHIRHLRRLQGGRVRGVIVDRAAASEFGEAVYGLRVEMPAGPDRGSRMLHAWILRDPEGNGPGFLDIEPAR